MKEKKEGNNKKIVALALALVLLIGGTYAWLTLTLTGTKTTRIEAGTLAVEINGESAGISIASAVPISTSEGIAQENPYEFTLENTGSVSSVYTVYLDDAGIDTENEFALAKSLVYAHITKQVVKDDGTPVGTATTVTKTLSELTNGTDVVLDTSTDATALASDEKINYTLRLWISDAAQNSDLKQDGKMAAYAGKIRIAATQKGIEEDEAYQ